MSLVLLIVSSFISLMIWLGLASVGHEFWLLSKYTAILIRIFEYGRKKIEIVEIDKQQKRRKLSRIEEEKGKPWFIVDEEDDEENMDEFSENRLTVRNVN